MTVALTRKNLSVLFAKEKDASTEFIENGEVIPEEEEKPETKKKTLPWQRNLKKNKKGGFKKGSGSGKKPASKKETDDKKKVSTTAAKTPSKSKEEASDSSSEEEEEEEDVEVNETDDAEADAGEKSASANNDSSEPEDDQLEKLQSDVALRRQRLLEGKSQISHSVHCPYYPLDKQEYWWAYITDRKQQMLLTAPYHITNLVEHEEIQLKFTAPFRPGLYTFAVCLRSDSYFGFDQMKDIKVTLNSIFQVKILISRRHVTCFFASFSRWTLKKHQKLLRNIRNGISLMMRTKMIRIPADPNLSLPQMMMKKATKINVELSFLFTHFVLPQTSNILSVSYKELRS